MSDFRPAICVDFDGVIHTYSKGWHDGTIYDPPFHRSLEALTLLMKHYAVIVHTTRDAGQVSEWLVAQGFQCCPDVGQEFWNDQTRLLVTSRKLPAVAYIDDRAIRFESWPQAIEDLVKFTGRTVGLS